MTDDAKIIAALADELQARAAPIEMVLRPVSAFQLAALLQLALRHPGIGNDVRRIGVTFIEHVRAYFADAPTISDVMRRGDDPTQDVPNNNPIPMPLLSARLYWRLAGGHVHCRLFVGSVLIAVPANLTYALAGALTFRDAEWPAVRAMFERAGIAMAEEA